jgi:hypothetical protein
VAAVQSGSAILALLTLPAELRQAVTESMTRDALDRPDQPIDPSRISMTAHLRSVLTERGLMGTWRRHLYECAHGSIDSVRLEAIA